MNIVIYANSSNQIGTGHVMRCLTLANYLKEKGSNIVFMTDSSMYGNISDIIISNGYKIITPSLDNIAKSTDWLIIDNYDIDYIFETEAKKYVKFIMVIDDLANRKHNCDLLLDQNLYSNMKNRYNDLVPKNCSLLLGPKYALLRDEFLEAKKELKARDGNINKIFINFGGLDHVDMTSRTLYSLQDFPIEIDIVIGKNSPNLEKIKRICINIPYFNLHINSSKISKLMSDADLAIVAGGSSTWERCYLELPSIIVAVADNQVELAKMLSKEKVCFYAGFYDDSTINLEELVNYCINNPDILTSQSKRMKYLVNGRGKEYVGAALLHTR